LRIGIVLRVADLIVTQNMSTEETISPGKIIARVAAGAALTMSSGHASASLDKFATWFLTAFGTGLALIVSQLKEVTAFIPLPTVALAAYLFLIAAVVCVAQRYVAMVITGGAKAAKEGREMGGQLQHMDGEEFIAQLLEGMPRLVRWMCKAQFDALKKGDYAVGGRMFMRLTMWQGLLVGIELLVLLGALTKIVNEIRA
jgi:hypothetical protein